MFETTVTRYFLHHSTGPTTVSPRFLAPVILTTSHLQLGQLGAVLTVITLAR
jgi:hypothetical protein